MSTLYGLVVCGGKSSRMGSDKSLLNYHGKPQRYHLYELMKPLCDRVFISCNRLQAPDIPAEYEVLVDDDVYENMGPLAALLTAYKHYPDSAFMLVGCDYPYVDSDALITLSKATLQSKNAVAYYNMQAEKYEPLLSGFQYFKEYYINSNLNLQNLSLQQILHNVCADIIIPKNDLIIKSIDTEDEYNKTLMQLYSTKKDNSF